MRVYMYYRKKHCFSMSQTFGVGPEHLNGQGWRFTKTLHSQKLCLRYDLWMAELSCLEM